MGMALLHAVIFFAIVQTGTAQIDPQHVKNLTVYHLNPASAGAAPINMDTGDAAGDLYFYLGEFLLPLECANASKEFRAHFDCDNPERVDPNLVVTKVDMQIDYRFTNYSACNLCNGTDPFTHKPCTVGTYVCDCFSHHHSGGCDASKVGAESIKDHFVHHPTTPTCAAALEKACGSVKTDSHQCGLCLLIHGSQLKAANCSEYDDYNFCPSQYGSCSATSPPWMCWAENIPRKTEGMWYSTLAAGQCNKATTNGGCGWQVESTTTVQNNCLKNKLMTVVEAASPSCFGGCGPRDTNSSCWIGCFFDGILGPEAAHSSTANLSGLPTSTLVKAWDDAFLPEADGGCAKVTIPNSWSPPLNSVLV